MKRSATAQWSGSGKEGSGKITSQSKIFNNTPYSWRTRFQDAEGTSPEEMLASAHASCVTMKLSFVLGEAGFTPEMLETTCTVTIEGGAITNSHLSVRAKVAGIAPEKFEECVVNAKTNCPVSKAFLTSITHTAVLESAAAN
jgi:osmotically inducible protein OsmC